MAYANIVQRKNLQEYLSFVHKKITALNWHGGNSASGLTN